MPGRARRPAWAGVDLGTQGARAVVVGEDGAVLGEGSAPLASHRRDGRHEQDPAQWWPAAATACRRALAQAAGHAAVLRAVAVCATSGTVVLTDAAGRPRGPALMYDDVRAGAQAREVQRAGEPLWAALGYRMQASWALPKLVWLVRAGLTAPAGTRLAHQADVVAAALVGHPVPTDTSNALKTGYDLLSERWPAGVLERLGVPLEVLPPVVPPGEWLGRVHPAAAAEAGLPAGIPVVAGMTDGCAAQLGAGALTPGEWNLVLGTTLVLKGVSTTLVVDPGGGLYSHRGPGGAWLPGGASSSGAGAVAARLPGADLDALGAAAAARLPSACLAYPLVGRGERFPFVAPQAEAFLLGDPGDPAGLLAALMQGVACVERLCLDHLDLLGLPTHGRRIVSGGGTRSPGWTQLRADMQQAPLHLPAHPGAAFGMAVLACAAEASGRATVGDSGPDLAGAAARMVRMVATVQPRARFAEPLREAYLGLVSELSRRGWLPAELAAHARARGAG